MQKELLPTQQYLNPNWYNFKKSKLGKLYESLPWGQLADLLPKEHRGPGAPRWFSARGMFGLIFLKAYLKIRDEALIERFNSDFSLQLFCNKLLKSGEIIRDKAIVSRIRSYLSEHVDMFQLQDILINHWKRDMNNTHVLLMDTTCYESYVRFPTDVKLLQEWALRMKDSFPSRQVLLLNIYPKNGEDLAFRVRCGLWDWKYF